MLTTGCGKKQDKNSTDESTTIETSTEETTDETSTETEETTVEETKAKNVENEVNITVQSSPETNKTVSKANQNNTQKQQVVKDDFKPNASGSPLQNVSGDVYKAVSNDVRSYANASATSQNVSSLKAKFTRHFVNFQVILNLHRQVMTLYLPVQNWQTSIT